MIQIIQTPGEINAAFGINAITLSGITEPGTRYRLEIWNGEDSALIASLIITPNQFGNGIADIKNVLQTLIRPSLINIEKTNVIADAFNETKEYIIKAIEVDLLDEPIGEYTQSPILLTTGGRKDGWQVTYTLPFQRALSDYNIVKKAKFISPKPSMNDNIDIKIVKLTKKDFYTLSYKNNFQEYTIYPYVGTTAQTPIIKQNNLSPNYPSIFVTIPAGIKNIVTQMPLGTDSYFIKVNNDWWYFIISDECETFEPIQLSWMNSYGFRDYYTFRKRVDKRTSVTRNKYNRSIIDFNFVGLQTTRGEAGDVIYNQGIEKEYIIRTDFISEMESELFENLIISPQVRARIGAEWFDVMPLSNDWRFQRFSTDQLFQFEYSFSIAQKINSQRA